MIKPTLLALAALAVLGGHPASALAVSPPANDNFASAISLSAGSSTVDGTAATAQPGEPAHYTIAGAHHATHSVWWKFTPTFSGTVQFDTNGSAYDTVMSVYTGTTFATLHRVAQNDDVGGTVNPKTSLIVIPVTKGVVYHIAVDGFSADITGSTTLTITTLRINTPRSYQTALMGADLQEDNGLLTVTTTTSSLVTGKLQLGVHSYPFTGAVAIDGHLLASIDRAGQQPVLLDVTVGSNNSGVVFGPITGSMLVGGNALTITAYPAAVFTAPAVCPRYALNRHYNYAMDTTGAVGYGVASVTVGKTGVCTSSGTLADGTAFLFSSPLLDDSGSADGNIGTGGSYCYHLPLYASQGQITGTASFDATTSPVSVTGTMQWYRPSPKAGTVFLPDGIFGSEVDTFGSFYTPPDPTKRIDVVFDPSGAATLAIGELDYPAFTKSDLNLNISNEFTYGATNPNLVKLAVNTNTGILTGTMKLTSNITGVVAKASTLKGIIIDHPSHPHQFFGNATSTTGTATLLLHP